MNMLAREVDHVIGVDTHRDSHTAAVVSAAGGLVAELTAGSDAAGSARLLAFAREQAPDRRVWAIEGTGSYGAGLTTFLQQSGERVVEVDHPRRPARRNGAKSDSLDALRAAREALSRDHLAEPRCRGEREALRVLVSTRKGAVKAKTCAISHFKALLVTSPEPLRQHFRGLRTGQQLSRAARMRTTEAQMNEYRCTVIALRSSARRVLALETEASELHVEIAGLVATMAPRLLEEPGVGAISAAQILCSWSHAGRVRSEAAFATLAGVAPVPASSGQTIRYRLNHGGDRQLNYALHTVALNRLTHHPETRAYAERRRAEGKTPREIRRCLKRHLARRIFKLLEAS